LLQCLLGGGRLGREAHPAGQAGLVARASASQACVSSVCQCASIATPSADSTQLGASDNACAQIASAWGAMA
jgi:hypothetical protein